MNNITQKLIAWMKKEVVLSAALVLAAASMFLQPPDREYGGYIDWNTLILLFCLMAVMAGFQKLGIFQRVGNRLLSSIHNTRQLMGVLVFLPFFFSMLITNDVSLITFVPFAIVVLRMSGKVHLLILVVVMQTLAANLGSILTPVGNPQNLYLYAQSGMALGRFLLLMLPYAVLSGICLFFVILMQKKEAVDYLPDENRKCGKSQKIYLICYSLVFILCLLSVAKQLKPGYLMIIVLVFLYVADRGIFGKIDYSLLGTFAGFFIFIGNIGRVQGFREILEKVLVGHETIAAVLSSQVISNVPAALLLSGFTDKWESLIIGTNLGGLGTLIASMASLISYKQIAQEYPRWKGKYFACFTVANIGMLAILLAAYFLLSKSVL